MTISSDRFARSVAIRGRGALPPGPPALPLIGAPINLLRFFADSIATMHRLQRRYGDVVALMRGRSDYVFAFGAANNRVILGNPSLFQNLDPQSMQVRVPQGSALSRLFNGLTHMNGAHHQQQRRLVTPAFAKPMLAPYLAEIGIETRRMLDTWRIGERRDIARDMGALSLSISTRILLGADPAESGHGVHRVMLQWIDLVFALTTMMLPFDVPGLPFRRLLALSTQLELEIRRLIARQRAQIAPKSCVLSALLQTHDGSASELTDDELIGHTALLFMASQSTTTNALTWTLLLLERHPEILQAVCDELAELDFPTPTFAQLQQPMLLDLVIKESLRLLPPVLLWCKVAAADFELGGYALPKGTKVIQSTLMTHRESAAYPEPCRFLPERWRGRYFDAYQFSAFSAGPRMCLGAALAMLEIKLIVAMVLQRFRLNTPRDHRVDVRGPMLLSPKRGLPMDLHAVGAPIERNPLRGSVRDLVDFPQ
jgi:cytochrome P450